MTARNLALEALKELVSHFGEEHSGKFYEGGCALCIAIERANAAISALEAETGEPVAWRKNHKGVVDVRYTYTDNPRDVAMWAELGVTLEPLYTAIAALEAETGEVAAWIGHSQVTGLKFAAMPDEHRSEACAPWIPTYTAPPPAVPPGWKLVPIEPTPEMWKVGLAHMFRDVDAVWRAMLAEVPEAPK